MDPASWGQLALQGGAVAGLIFLAWASSTGKIWWSEAVLKLTAFYESQLAQARADLAEARRTHAEELARLEARNDQLFADLRETVRAAHRAADASRQAAEVAGVVVTRSQQ